MKIGSTFLTVVLSMLLGAAIVAGITLALDDGDGSTTTATRDARDSGAADAVAAGGNLLAPTDYSNLYENVRDSIVRITTGDASLEPFERLREGLGSGVVMDTEGHILTNFHVVRGYDEVTVTFSDGTAVEARVVGRDPGNDIAMIKATAEPSLLKPARLGDSASVRVGEPVAALGNPFGLDGSFTTGVISGLGRTLPSSSTGRPIRNLLQTDTAVNPGNSGGALFNIRGEVVGINTAIENPNGTGFVGVAYAVPINTPKRFLTQLIAGETIEHARLGISGRTMTQNELAELGIPYGVVVLAVDSGGAADRAGLRASTTGVGDVIIEIDGEAMRTFEDLADYIDTRGVGDEVTLLVYRDGEEIEIAATLRSWDSSA